MNIGKEGQMFKSLHTAVQLKAIRDANFSNADIIDLLKSVSADARRAAVAELAKEATS